MNQQVSPYYHSILTLTQKYHSKVTPIGALHAEKKAEAFLFFLFRILFSVSPLLESLMGPALGIKSDW